MNNFLTPLPDNYTKAINSNADCCAKCYHWSLAWVDGYVECGNPKSPNKCISCSPHSVCNHFREKASNIIRKNKSCSIE